MLTLDEAIKHCEEKAKEIRQQALKRRLDIEGIAECETCAQEHEQLAEWLKELKRYREMGTVSIPVSVEASTIPLACRTCSNHPSNGGSGICHCTLGSNIIY